MTRYESYNITLRKNLKKSHNMRLFEQKTVV